MQPRGVVLLHDEAVALALELSAARLLRLREVALLVISLDVERHAPGHGYALLRAGAFAGSFLADFLAALDLLAEAFSRFSSPRLFFSAAMRSMTFEPLGGGASASGSSITFSPLAFFFSSIRRWSAST